MGLSDVFIEDVIYGEMSISQATDAACSMYVRNGRIALLGIERVATDSAWLHIKNALSANGRYIDLKKKDQFGGNLQLLSPSGRAKNYKIESNLAWPLNNSKLHLIEEMSIQFVDALRNECEKFPFYHVDILDALAYVYDLLGDKALQFYFYAEEEELEPIEVADNYTGRSALGGY
jgi:hypothetical protein